MVVAMVNNANNYPQEWDDYVEPPERRPRPENLPDRAYHDRVFRDAIQRRQGQLRRNIDEGMVRALHGVITGQGFGFHEIVRECLELFGG